MDMAYMEMLFSAALINRTIRAAAVDEYNEIKVVYLNLNIVATQRYDNGNVYVDVCLCNYEDVSQFYSRVCQLETNDADRLKSLFDSVFNYAKMHCTYEELDENGDNIKERIINHRLKYF